MQSNSTSTSDAFRDSAKSFLADMGGPARVRRLRDASGEEIELLGGEYELLMVFLQRPQQVLTREQLMDWLKGRSWASFDRSIDVAVSRLRRKIELDPAQPALIKTVRNGGYVFSVAVEHR